MLEHLQVPDLGHWAFEADALHLEEGVEAHHAHAHAAFAHGGVFGARHFFGRAVDVILQDIVEEAHHVFDEGLVLVPLVPFFQVEAGKAAHRGAIVAEVVDAGGQGNLRTQIGRRHLEAQIRDDAWASCGLPCRKRRCRARLLPGGFPPASGTGCVHPPSCGPSHPAVTEQIERIRPGAHRFHKGLSVTSTP